jgi:nucleotide-binding universal stress UspA family protein
MTFVVPFDGSALAEAALVRATEFAIQLDERVLAVTVIPTGNTDYAREHDWIGPDEDFDTSAVVSTLNEQVTDLCPSADFRHEIVDRYAPSGTIARRIRDMIRDVDASIVFIGSDNAGHLVGSVGSVGQSVTTIDDYDVMLIRNRTPSKVAKIRDESPYAKRKSDFYLPE